MNRRLFFTKLATTVALLAASPVVGRIVSPPKWIVNRWSLEWVDHQRIMMVGVEVVSGSDTRRHAVGYEIRPDTNIAQRHETAKLRLTEWVDNLNAA